MCWCRPEIRTPVCDRLGCVPPQNFPSYAQQLADYKAKAQARTGEQAAVNAAPVPGVDELVARARRLAERLNATLGELGALNVETLSVIDHDVAGGQGYMPRRMDRVSLCLNFKAARPT